jgi:quinoprotein dehydrogenase-associated probable ABC transporter substrate-binding protein
VRKSKQSSSPRFLALLAGLACCIGTALAQNDEPFEMPRALKVCADPNNLPFSNEKGEGFENRIAELLAAKLGLSVEYFHYPQRINVVRNTINYKLPGESEYRCDLLTGVPAEFSAGAVTRPYFRSTYVLVYVKGRKLDVNSAEQFLALDPALLSSLRIGVYDRTPATTWLLKHKLIERAVPYRILDADPSHYPGRIIEQDLVQGKVDAVIVWGPIGGYFAKRVKNAELAVVPLRSEPGVRFDFGVAMGMRRGEPGWLGRVQQALDESQGDITRILREYGVPLVNDDGTVAR